MEGFVFILRNVYLQKNISEGDGGNSDLVSIKLFTFLESNQLT